MKKILYTLSAFLLFGSAFATADFSGAIGQTSMPSDAQIWAIVSRFNIDDETKQKVFLQTKQKLQAMYKNEDVTNANNDLNSAAQILNTGALDEYISESDKRQALQGISNLPSVNKGSVQTTTEQDSTSSKNKKYAKHDPISKHDPIIKRKKQ